MEFLNWKISFAFFEAIEIRGLQHVAVACFTDGRS